MNEKILQLVTAALRDLGTELNRPELAAPPPDLRLFGAQSPLDSMALVSLIADVEARLATEFGRDLVLADERAMSALRSPFRTVASLVAHIEQRLQESPAP
jgi:acyl carrier protein